MSDLSDAEIEKLFIASGIDMKKIALTRLVSIARDYAPRFTNGSICIAPKGSDIYYENVYFAAKARNRTLVELFLATGFQLTEDQRQEISEIIPLEK